jgi:hypothetical protein
MNTQIFLFLASCAIIFSFNVIVVCIAKITSFESTPGSFISKDTKRILSQLGYYCLSILGMLGAAYAFSESIVDVLDFRTETFLILCASGVIAPFCFYKAIYYGVPLLRAGRKHGELVHVPIGKAVSKPN